MKKKKKYLSLALALVFSLTTALPFANAANELAEPGTYTTVSASSGHTAAIDQNGALWMWGDNSYGQIGNGGNENQNTPVKIMDNVASVSCAYHTTAAIKTDGSLWMWGNNSVGELGNGGIGNTKDAYGLAYQTIPVKIMDNVAAVGCSGYATAAIKTDGSLWMWGSNIYGELGNGGTETQEIPVKIMDNVAAVNCQYDHTAAIKTDGSLWMWGSNHYGQLGNGGGGNDQPSISIFSSTAVQNVPIKIMDNVAAISCGDNTVAAIKKDGSLWMWGLNNFGQLGNGDCGSVQMENGAAYSVYQTIPTKIMDNVAAVSCEGSYTAAIKTDGSLWMWGDNRGGSLGNGGGGNAQGEYDSVCQTIPTKIMDNVAAVSCSGGATAVIKTNGSLWMWGGNIYGQLGNGGNGNDQDKSGDQYQTIPIKIMDNVAAVTFGDCVTAAIKVDGSLWTCGANEYGQLGNGGQGNFYVYIDNEQESILCQNVFGKVLDNVKLPVSGASPSAQTAQPTNDKLAVNGISQIPTAYKIGGANYFKLRDLAAMLNGSAKQFSVGYDGSIRLTTNQPYQNVGGELSGATAGAQSASVSNDVVYIDGEQKKFTIYKINGANYFKLRDLGEALNFYVGWTKEHGIYIETNKPYQD